MGRKQMKPVLILSGIFVALFMLALIAAVRTLCVASVWRRLPEDPRAGVWYRVDPPGALNSTGDSWHGLFRLGTENRVMIYFMGGGFSIDQDSARQDEEFYYHRSSYDELTLLGITAQDDRNPFRDWTMIVLPYSTADFHVGTADFSYEDQAGRPMILHHSGFRNFRLMMDAIRDKVGAPDTVLITGWSAGGFGAAMLSDGILRDYFPETARSVVLVDSAVLSADWPGIVRDVWQAPPEVADALRGPNLTLDSLTRLSRNHPETTILFSCSCRDAILSQYQNYLTAGAFVATAESTQAFQKQLKETVDGVLALENTGVFLWDDHPENARAATGHISIGKRFFASTFDGTTIAQWLSDAVGGSVSSHGLTLLEPEE